MRQLLSDLDQTDTFLWSDPLTIGKDGFKRRLRRHKEIKRARTETILPDLTDANLHGTVKVICKDGKYLN